MSNRFEGSGLLSRANLLGSLAALFLSITLPAVASTQSFTVPDDVALRIRLDDTLTSVNSQVGDPFSATVVDKGDYQDARVYGHIAQIDMSGKIKDQRTYEHDVTIRPPGYV